MKIDVEYIDDLLKDRNNREIKFSRSTNDKLTEELDKSYVSLKKWVEIAGKYTKAKIASFILSLYRWRTSEENNKLRFHKDKSKRPRVMQYDVRDIIFADFGATNFGVEASFEHPAIVLHNGFYFLVVIPGSTGRSGKGDYILDADKKENFYHKTGIQIDQIRVIDKSRVIRKTGKKVPPEFMDKINDVILEKYLFPVKKKMDNLEKENKELKIKIKDLEEQLEKQNEIVNN